MKILKLPYRVFNGTTGQKEISYSYINASTIIEFKEYSYNDDYSIAIRYAKGNNTEHISAYLTLDQFMSMLEKAGVVVIDCGVDPELSNFVKESWGNTN